MKKIYALLLVAAGTVLSTNAQPFEKGNKLLGGSLNFAKAKNIYNSPGYESTGFSIAPSLGLFTKPNRLTGISLNYAHGKTNDYKFDGFGASVYRQYWSPLGKGFYYITEGSLTGNYSRNRPTNSPSNFDNNKSISTSFSIDPGIAYRVNKKLVLDLFFTNFLYVTYTHTNTKRTPPYPTSQPTEYNQSLFSVGTGFSNFAINNLNFGFRFVL